MAFLYPAFLLGALAIALPIVLHLLRRDVAPEVPFTAVHLLRKSPIERSRRRRLRDLLLLAARVAALLLLATAFARPYHAATAAASRVVIIAVDRSYSMGAPGRFERALELARSAIDSARGARVSLIAFDERADVLSAAGTAAEARNVLDGLQPGFAATRYGPVLSRATELAEGGPARLVIVTDLQRTGWEDEQPTVVPSTLDVEIADAGESSVNVAVTQVRAHPATIIATLRNGAATPFTGTLQLALDGRPVASAPVTVVGGATVDVPVRYQAPRAGTLSASVDDGKGFSADNTRYVLLDPVPRPHVLIVTTSGQDSQSGFYLSRALEAAAPEADAIEGDIVEGPALSRMTAEEISRRAAVVLLSTRGIDRRGRETLTGFVRAGGGLLIAAGPDVDPSALSGIVNWTEVPRPSGEDDRPLALSASDLRHPVFRPFGGLVANLGQVRFDRAWRVRADGWQVAASFTDGSPALIERTSGSGRVVLFASDFDRRWNDFPLHPVFVPFVLESVRYAIGRDQRGREYPVSHAPAGAPSRPGVFRLPPDNRAVVVNVDPRESSVSRLTRDEFAAMLQRVSTPASAASNLRAQQTEARQSYWRYGLVIMLLALVGESFAGRVG